MNSDDVFGEVLEKGQQAVKQTTNVVSDAAKMAADQIAGQKDTAGDQASNDSSTDIQAAKDMVKDFYAPSNPGQAPVSKDLVAQEDASKLAQVKQQLHNEVYYDPLVNRPKKQEEEERPAERVERQEMEDLQAEQKKQKEKPDFAMQRAQRQAEVKGGVSG